MKSGLVRLRLGVSKENDSTPMVKEDPLRRLGIYASASVNEYYNPAFCLSEGGALGRVDIHRGMRLWADFAHLGVAPLARCAASRSALICTKSTVHSLSQAEGQHARGDHPRAAPLFSFGESGQALNAENGPTPIVWATFLILPPNR